MTRAGCRAATLLTFVVVLVLAAPPARAQGKTDVVTLANGDRITCEVSKLERGRLELKTDDIGTIYVEWDKVVSVIAARLVEVTTTDGRAFLGSLQPAPNRTVAVAGGGDTLVLSMQEVTLISQIGRSFWSRLDGSVDLGFSYTKSSGVAQLNLNADTIFRAPGRTFSITASFTQTDTGDGNGKDDRGALETAYVRDLGQKWFAMGLGRLETNESLGLELRLQAGATLGVRTLSSNRAVSSVAGGLSVNNEQGVDVETTQNVEALTIYRVSYFTYDRPKTNLDLTVQYYASVTDFGRHRVQFDAGARREMLKDLFLALSIYDSFDSRPPNPDADSNDVGVVFSVGWSY